jgi:hypothetical protein
MLGNGGLLALYMQKLEGRDAIPMTELFGGKVVALEDGEWFEPDVGAIKFAEQFNWRSPQHFQSMLNPLDMRSSAYGWVGKRITQIDSASQSATVAELHAKIAEQSAKIRQLEEELCRR